MLKLMYITDSPEVARIAEDAGVDRIFVDLEVIGKAQRQGGMDTVQSHHTLNTVSAIRRAITRAELLVRCNPLHPGSQAEIDAIIERGADVVMLPFFHRPEQAADFIRMVGGRVRTCLLLETPAAAESVDRILDIPGIDEIHIGLNDLHLGYGMKFLFQPLADGTVERLASKIRHRGIPFGFGGVARPGSGALPAESILREHYRIGSSMVIVSRRFCNTDEITDLDEIRRIFTEGIPEIRAIEMEAKAHADYFEQNRRFVCSVVDQIVASKH